MDEDIRYVCIHSKYGECPYKKCNLNIANIGIIVDDEFSIEYVDMGCTKYMDN